MRLKEILTNENGDQYANLVSVLMFLKNSAQERNLTPKIGTESLINLVKNSGQPAFEFDDLIAASKQDPAAKELIKTVNRDEVVIRSENADEVTTEPEGTGGSVKNPEQTVKSMAQKALNRRQD